MNKALLVLAVLAAPAAARAPVRLSPRLTPVFTPALSLTPSLTVPSFSSLLAPAPADGPVLPTSFGRFASIIPPWFDASRLEVVLARQDTNGFALAILRRGRFELAVYLDARNGDQAIFTQHALNPMGTPRTETVTLGSGPARRAVAELLRRASAPDEEGQALALGAMVAALEKGS